MEAHSKPSGALSVSVKRKAEPLPGFQPFLKIAFASCAKSYSNSPVFDEIADGGYDMFMIPAQFRHSVPMEIWSSKSDHWFISD